MSTYLVDQQAIINDGVIYHAPKQYGFNSVRPIAEDCFFITTLKEPCCDILIIGL